MILKTLLDLDWQKNIMISLLKEFTVLFLMMVQEMKFSNGLIVHLFLIGTFLIMNVRELLVMPFLEILVTMAPGEHKLKTEMGLQIYRQPQLP